MEAGTSRTRKGVVYIAPVDKVPADGSMVSPDSRFSASWQSNEEGLLEDCPECANADEAIAWGRARAATVLIRLGHSASKAQPRRYVENRSPWLDVKNVARTPRALFTGTYEGKTGGWQGGGAPGGCCPYPGRGPPRLCDNARD